VIIEAAAIAFVLRRARDAAQPVTAPNRLRRLSGTS
jgi:hypothetical protein